MMIKADFLICLHVPSVQREALFERPGSVLRCIVFVDCLDFGGAKRAPLVVDKNLPSDWVSAWYFLTNRRRYHVEENQEVLLR